MPNNWFQFKEFRVEQKRSTFKVGTDSALLGAWSPIQGSENILDIGAGTGILSLMCAQRNEQAIITAIEQDENSFKDCHHNFKNSPWPERLKAIHNPLQDFKTEQKFDHIISNPPYFSKSTLNPDLRLSKARHELSLSLDILIKSSAELLEPTGNLSLVIPAERKNDLMLSISRFNLYIHEELLIKPTPTKPVNRILICLGKEPKEVHSRTIILYASPNVYSDVISELLKPFYLKL